MNSSRKFILAWFSRQRLRARRLAPDDEPSPRRYDPRQRRSPVSVPASSASPSASASSSEVVIKQEYEEPSLSGIDSADSQPKKRRRIRKPPQPKTAVRAIGVQAPATKRQKTNASSRTDKPNPVDNAAAHISYPGHPGDMPSEEPTAHHPVALPVALPLAVHIPSTLSRNRSLSLSSRTSSPPSPPLPSNFVSFISPLKLTVPSLADRKLGSALRIDTNLAFDESDMLIHPPQPITAGAPLRGQRDIARKIAVSLSAAEPVPAPPPLASMVNLLSPSELDLQSNASVSPSPDVVTPAATERDDWLSTPSPGTPISLVNAAKFDHRMPVETAVPIVIGAPGTDETIDLSHIFAKDVTDSVGTALVRSNVADLFQEASPTPPPTSELPDSFDLFDFTDLGSPEEAITPPEFEAEANAITIGAPLMDENIDLSHIFAQDTTVLVRSALVKPNRNQLTACSRTLRRPQLPNCQTAPTCSTSTSRNQAHLTKRSPLPRSTPRLTVCSRHFSSKRKPIRRVSALDLACSRHLATAEQSKPVYSTSRSTILPTNPSPSTLRRICLDLVSNCD